MSSPRARSAHEPALGPFAVALIITCGVFLVAGIAWPHAAAALLRLLLATLAVGFVLARAYEAFLPARMGRGLYSPFDGDLATRTPPLAPQGLRELTRELSAADDPRLARRTAIPWSLRQTVIEEASRRLEEHHGLTPSDRDHHLQIRRLVSEPTWHLLRSGSAHGASGGRARAERTPVERAPGEPSTGPARSVPLNHLGLILDDLERL